MTLDVSADLFDDDQDADAVRLEQKCVNPGLIRTVRTAQQYPLTCAGASSQGVRVLVAPVGFEPTLAVV